VVILKHWLSRVSASLVLDGTCLKDPELSGVFHLLFFLRSKEAMQMALGAAFWDLPTP
jgi:hypothetical protein